MRVTGVIAPPPKGSGQSSVWFAVAAATGGLVAAIGTSIVAHDRALEGDQPMSHLPSSGVTTHPGLELAAAQPDASTTHPQTGRKYVTLAH